MRVDLYTKFVLTVIALCLIWLSIGGPGILPTARAQVLSRERVIIAGWADDGGVIHTLPRYLQLNGVPVTEVGAIEPRGARPTGVHFPLGTNPP